MTMLYDHGAGDAHAQAFKVAAQALHEHADELLRNGTALVNESLHGSAAQAFHHSLTVHVNSAKHIAETIQNHSNAVTSSFHGMHGTDLHGAQIMST
jgi:uncharacterized protein YukE